MFHIVAILPIFPGGGLQKVQILWEHSRIIFSRWFGTNLSRSCSRFASRYCQGYLAGPEHWVGYFSGIWNDNLFSFCSEDHDVAINVMSSSWWDGYLKASWVLLKGVAVKKHLGYCHVQFLFMPWHPANSKSFTAHSRLRPSLSAHV